MSNNLLDWSFSPDLMHFQSWFFHLWTLATVICFSLPSSHILLSSTISPLRTLFLAETQSVHVLWDSLHSASWYLPCFWHLLRLASEEVSYCLQMDSRVGFLSSVLTATPLSKPPRCWYLVSLALLHGSSLRVLLLLQVTYLNLKDSDKSLPFNRLLHWLTFLHPSHHFLADVAFCLSVHFENMDEIFYVL